MKINIVPEKTTIGWAGGIDDTLGLFLLIEQYGASSINVVSLGKNHDKARSIHKMPSFTEELMGMLKIDTTKFVYVNEDVRRHAYRNIVPLEAGKPGATWTLSEESLLVYYMLENEFEQYTIFNTEESGIRIVDNYLGGRHMQYYIPKNHKYAYYKQKLISNPTIFNKMPFYDSGITRHDVVEMYYQKGLQHLLPLTRSCGVKINQVAFNTTVLMTSELLHKNVHCGVCPRCLKRKYGFKSYGVQDPTTYLA